MLYVCYDEIITILFQSYNVSRIDNFDQNRIRRVHESANEKINRLDCNLGKPLRNELIFKPKMQKRNSSLVNLLYNVYNKRRSSANICFVDFKFFCLDKYSWLGHVTSWTAIFETLSKWVKNCNFNFGWKRWLESWFSRYLDIKSCKARDFHTQFVILIVT